VKQEGDSGLFKNVPQQQFTVQKYSKLRGLINPYTWGLNIGTDLVQANVGIASRDLLSTTSINVGYVFDLNERTGSYKAQASYQGWFPIIDVAASFADRKVDEGDITYSRVVTSPATGIRDTVRVVKNLTFKWQEQTIEAGLRIPLNLTRSRFSTNVSFGNNVGYTVVSEFQNSIDGGGRLVPSNPALAEYLFREYADNGTLVYNHFNLAAYRLLKQSRRDINSKWGQRIIVNSYSTPYGGDFSGNQFSFYGLGYFPGFVKHHSLWGYWAYQKTLISRANVSTGDGLNNYFFRNQIPLPRGQSVSRFQEFYSMSVNYTLPLWYPDVAIGPLLNIQRLRTNLFFDYGFGQSKLFNSNGTYSSAGIEAKLDINILRFFPQFDIGVRYAVGLEPSTTRFEVLVGTFNF
jgi:hypothetical protein